MDEIEGYARLKSVRDMDKEGRKEGRESRRPTHGAINCTATGYRRRNSPDVCCTMRLAEATRVIMLDLLNAVFFQEKSAWGAKCFTG